MPHQSYDGCTEKTSPGESTEEVSAPIAHTSPPNSRKSSSSAWLWRRVLVPFEISSSETLIVTTIARRINESVRLSNVTRLIANERKSPSRLSARRQSRQLAAILRPGSFLLLPGLLESGADADSPNAIGQSALAESAQRDWVTKSSCAT